MQQATVNLFADMGVQPRHAEVRAWSRRSQSTDATRADLDDHVAGASGTTFATGHRHDQRHGDRQRRRHRRRRRGVDRRRRHLAPRQRARRAGPTRGRRAARAAPTRSEPRVRRQRQHRDTVGAASPCTVDRSATCPCTIWAPAHAVPRRPTIGDPGAVELGTRFRSRPQRLRSPASASTRAAANTGTHTGRLWTNTGTLLGTVTFTGETASGWQQATLRQRRSPITANTTYVVSYHAPNGHYTGTDNFFAPQASTTAAAARPARRRRRRQRRLPLRAGGSFPTETWQLRDYWVDVVFSTGPPPDTTRADRDRRVPGERRDRRRSGATVTATLQRADGSAR